MRQCTHDLALSSDGRTLVSCEEGELRVGGRGFLPCAEVAALAALDRAIWVVAVRDGTHWLHRFDDHGEPYAAATALGSLGEALAMSAPRTGARVALIRGTRACVVRERSRLLDVEELGAELGGDRRVLLGARGIIERRGSSLRFLAAGQPASLALPAEARNAIMTGGALVLDDAACVIEMSDRDGVQLLVFELRRGSLLRRIRIESARVMAVAERRGLVVLGNGRHLALLDVRQGRCMHERVFPRDIVRVATDGDGTQFAIADDTGALELVGDRLVVPDIADLVQEPAEEVETAPEVDEEPLARGPDPELAAAELPPPEPPARVAHPPLRIGIEQPGPRMSSADRVAYLEDAFDLVASMCRRAVAVARDTGRFDGVSASISAVLDRTSGGAIGTVDIARRLEHSSLARFARWNRVGAPIAELVRELALSPLGAAISLLVAAPYLWAELAPIYRLLAGDPGRPLVDEHLVAQLLGVDRAGRRAVSRELVPDAPLVRRGIVRCDGTPPFVALSVSPVLVQRLAGDPVASGSCVRGASAALDEIVAPPGAIDGLIAKLACDRATPLRLVVRGRPASGRRTLAAAVAATAGRKLGLVEIGASAEPEAVLRRTLCDLALRGLVPCVDLDHVDDELLARIGHVLDRHAGPLVLRARPGVRVPLAPGHVVFEFPALDGALRRRTWESALASRGLSIEPAAMLAQRHSLEVGAIARVATMIEDAPSLDRAVVAAIRQHRSDRISAIADRVDRSVGWDDLVVPDDVVESLRELVGRIRHRDRVLHDWKLERLSGRGVTALFQGGPGTGKTLAASVIANEIGCELYRVDLSRVLSKWLGETEKNLAQVFDAAEEGDVVLLFDEADSLFGKRTEVKSSNDRHANAEVNYLLQRLDSFQGIAILTTNFGTSIDAAFRRRLALHLQFPAPDESERARLWQVHIPPSVPTSGDLGLDKLAARFRLSGGYIRNVALRACFLAAGEGGALTADHLIRAARLEYRDKAKISEGGLLE